MHRGGGEIAGAVQRQQIAALVLKDQRLQKPCPAAGERKISLNARPQSFRVNRIQNPAHPGVAAGHLQANAAQPMMQVATPAPGVRSPATTDPSSENRAEPRQQRIAQRDVRLQPMIGICSRSCRGVYEEENRREEIPRLARLGDRYWHGTSLCVDSKRSDRLSPHPYLTSLSSTIAHRNACALTRLRSLVRKCLDFATFLAVRESLVSLSHTRITDDAVSVLNRFPKIEVVDLSNTQIGDGGIRKLEHSKSLRLMGLNSTKIGVEWVRFLKSFPSIECVEIGGTPALTVIVEAGWAGVGPTFSFPDDLPAIRVKSL